MKESQTRPVPPQTGSQAPSYAFGPFCLHSEIDLPELRGPLEPGLHPVSIRLGNVPRTIAGEAHPDYFCTVSATEYLLEIPDAARFHVVGGSEVTVEIPDGVLHEDVRIYLLGSVFGALCHQNGYLPLHGSSVQSETGVTTFLGESGAGKSTLGAGLRRRGYPIVSDDICLIADTACNRIIPLAGWLKLWQESFDYLNQTPDPADRVFSTDNKYRLHLSQPVAASAQLTRIVIIERSPDPHERPRLERMATSAAMIHLMSNVYLPFYAEATGTYPAFFARCAQILGNAETFRLVAPWGWESLEFTLSMLEEQLLSPAGIAVMV